MSSTLVEQAAEFDERNLFLLLALGLLRAGERLDSLLREFAPEHAAATYAAAIEDDPLAHLLLGAIKVRDTVHRELVEASLYTRAEAPCSRAAAPGANAEAPSPRVPAPSTNAEASGVRAAAPGGSGVSGSLLR